ncbi:hypothetical protein HanPSC8_Chr07g0304661 [Helianthus annuus]|nr:hypothetical protein HanPSC8_Chr07g0304661 [Helianthus annuus]
MFFLSPWKEDKNFYFCVVDVFLQRNSVLTRSIMNMPLTIFFERQIRIGLLEYHRVISRIII